MSKTLGEEVLGEERDLETEGLGGRGTYWGKLRMA